MYPDEFEVALLRTYLPPGKARRQAAFTAKVLFPLTYDELPEIFTAPDILTNSGRAPHLVRLAAAGRNCCCSPPTHATHPRSPALPCCAYSPPACT